MSIINNQNIILLDQLKVALAVGNEVLICTPYFTYNAYYNLIVALNNDVTIRIIIGADELHNQKSNFIRNINEIATDATLQGYYRVEKALSHMVEYMTVRFMSTSVTSFIVVGEHVFLIAPNSFDDATLGIVKDGKSYLLTQIQGAGNDYRMIFDQYWSMGRPCKNEVLRMLREANALKTPHDVYQYTLFHIFSQNRNLEFKEDKLEKTGFKSSVIWSKLFSFQRDAVLGAIDKIEKWNGCIIADSVGLGKTFEALAVIKYYELRNDRVLVLAPKKLRDNWIAYTKNYTTNILERDRFNYDVLNHSDLSREGGMSGDIDLTKVHWGNYDLVVIDESHNFRNNNPGKGTLSRYARLMADIIKAGVKTKVLLLSATPVNTRLNDLKNQFAFITESNDQALKSEGINSIELTLRRAQSQFNAWLKSENQSREDLIGRLDGDYYKLLDIFTISRSRKHIEKYYDVADIGKFPERLKPVSIYSNFDTQDAHFSISELNDSLQSLNLRFYSPMYFVFEHLKPYYAERYDTPTNSGGMFSQLEREEGIITLMRVNLLKRLESSVNSFCLTLRALLTKIEVLLEKLSNHTSFLDQVAITDLDFDDEALQDAVIGGKVKVLIQDIDRVKMREFLHADRRIIEKLLARCEEITVQRDQKFKDLLRLIEDKLQNPINAGNKKVIVFSAFADTAKYLYQHSVDYFRERYQLHTALVTGGEANKTNLAGCKTDLQSILTNFSPVSKSRKSIFPNQTAEIDILFCTDCISEGQNLQDCDFLVNYDIHWNPVRIIQRFGRIDRIGSTNSYIQLVNFYPHIELDQYIDLVQRVKGRMQILDISANGDDNVIDERSGQQQELEYRKKQLERMREQVVDLEDLEGGISISDLTFNDFKVDVERISEQERAQFEHYAGAVFSLTANTLLDHPSGVLFCLKDREETLSEEKLQTNLLHPFALVYIDHEGTIQVPMRLGKKALDVFKKLAFGKERINQDLLKEFNLHTHSGKHMGAYVALLDVVRSHLSGEEKMRQAASIFNAKGSVIGKADTESHYEVISYLIVY